MRGGLSAILATACAPAIVTAANLMRPRGLVVPEFVIWKVSDTQIITLPQTGSMMWWEIDGVVADYIFYDTALGAKQTERNRIYLTQKYSEVGSEFLSRDI